MWTCQNLPTFSKRYGIPGVANSKRVQVLAMCTRYTCAMIAAKGTSKSAGWRGAGRMLGAAGGRQQPSGAAPAGSGAPPGGQDSLPGAGRGRRGGGAAGRRRGRPAGTRAQLDRLRAATDAARCGPHPGLMCPPLPPTSTAVVATAAMGAHLIPSIPPPPTRPPQGATFPIRAGQAGSG